MIRKLQVSGQSGLNVYAIIRDLSDLFWDGTELAAASLANYASYASTTLTEFGATGMYSGNVPEALPIGRYHFTYKNRAGASPAASDRVIHQLISGWDGVQLIDEIVVGSSIASICNLALSHLGVGKEIANLETEASEEAQVCRRFYELTRDDVLREFQWPFARRVVSLPLIQETPTQHWQYSYRYPGNALYIYKILGPTRVETRDSQIPFKVYGDDQGRLIYTDAESATAEYVARVENPLRFHPDFVLALSYMLAANIAPRMTAGDPYKLGNRAMEMYAFTIRKAKASAANEAVSDIPADSDMIRARYS